MLQHLLISSNTWNAFNANDDSNSGKPNNINNASNASNEINGSNASIVSNASLGREKGHFLKMILAKMWHRRMSLGMILLYRKSGVDSVFFFWRPDFIRKFPMWHQSKTKVKDVGKYVVFFLDFSQSRSNFSFNLFSF